VTKVFRAGLAASPKYAIRILVPLFLKRFFFAKNAGIKGKNKPTAGWVLSEKRVFCRVGSGIPEPRRRGVFGCLDEEIKKGIKPDILRKGLYKAVLSFLSHFTPIIGRVGSVSKIAVLGWVGPCPPEPSRVRVFKTYRIKAFSVGDGLVRDP